jgi:arylsulfatase A-like enzyme
VFEFDRSGKPAYVRDATHTIHDGRAERDRQLRTLLSVDDAVQAIHDKLATLGQLDDTLVIYIGDNGFYWADHGLVGKEAPYRHAHEVPFYVSWPAGGLSGGRKDDRIVANIDIAPTVLAAAGVTPTIEPDGTSLLSSVSRDHILTEWWRRDGRSDKDTWASYVSKERQYVEYYDLYTDEAGNEVGTGRVTFREYYDLVDDPCQLDNKLHRATPADEHELGIGLLSSRLADDRNS